MPRIRDRRPGMGRGFELEAMLRTSMLLLRSCKVCWLVMKLMWIEAPVTMGNSSAGRDETQS